MANLLVVEVEGHGVTDEVLSTGFETELFVDYFHAVHIEVDTYVTKDESRCKVLRL